MMASNVRLGILVFSLALAVGLAGCTGKSPKSDFYTLGPTPATRPVAQLSADMAIAVGPVTIPAELDRKQIVSRDGGNRIKVSELSRWAGPLQDNITAVLTANLATRLGTDKVAPHYRESLFPFTHQVVLNINRFDGNPKGEVLLDATWSIKQNGQSAPLVIKHSEIRTPVTTPDYNGLVAAQSKALAGLSNQIAAALGQLAP